jgi:hypothetical protein
MTETCVGGPGVGPEATVLLGADQADGVSLNKRRIVLLVLGRALAAARW